MTIFSLDILNNSIKQAIKKKYKDVTLVARDTDASLAGTKYSEGMFVSFGRTSGLTISLSHSLFFIIAELQPE